jgi:ABC-type enterochelin transport system substrate-binding protein
MKFRTLTILMTLTLATALLLGACGGGSANNANNATPKPTATAATPTAVSDSGDKAKIEEALKKAGFTDVTVDTTTTPATLRGTCAKGKLADVTKAAVEAAGKPVKNEVTEK